MDLNFQKYIFVNVETNPFQFQCIFIHLYEAYFYVLQYKKILAF